MGPRGSELEVLARGLQEGFAGSPIWQLKAKASPAFISFLALGLAEKFPPALAADALAAS